MQNKDNWPFALVPLISSPSGPFFSSSSSPDPPKIFYCCSAAEVKSVVTRNYRWTSFVRRIHKTDHHLSPYSPLRLTHPPKKIGNGIAVQVTWEENVKCANFQLHFIAHLICIWRTNWQTIISFPIPGKLFATAVLFRSLSDCESSLSPLETDNAKERRVVESVVM